MTEELMMNGKFGAEILSDIINKVFDPVITLIYMNGGFITAFVGDAIPKIEGKSRLRSFDDIFLETKDELTNLGRYSTYLVESSDVGNLDKRDMRDSLMKEMDYTVKFRIETKNSFAKYFFSGFISSVTLSIIPASYTKYFYAKAEVFNRNNELLATYERKAEVSNWYQMFLIFAYPFHPEIRKIEEVHLDILRDIFKQIESEGILKKY